MEEKENEKVIENNQNKKSPVAIIIIILLMLVFLFSGYFLSASGIVNFGKEENSGNPTPVPEVTKPEVKSEVIHYEITDAKISKLIEKLTSGGLECNAIEYFAKDKKVEAKDISNFRAYHIAESNEFFNSGKQTISLDEFTKVVQSYLGKDYSFNPESIDYKDSCPQYKYDSNTKTFTKQETACGGTCGPRTLHQIIKAVDTDGVLELKVKVAFVKNDGTYYADYARTNKITNTMDENVSYDKADTYKFIFKTEGDNYVFVSAEPVK